MAQLKDLLVTGAGRFLNNIYGNLIGNATSSDKVNHTFTVMGVSFNGSENKTVTQDEINTALGLDDTMKLVGKVDTRLTVLEEGTTNTVINSTTNSHVIFLTEKYATQRTITPGTATVDGSSLSILYYTPQVGDVVLQNEAEYICTSVTKNGTKVTGSNWVALDTSGYWYTW